MQSSDWIWASLARTNRACGREAGLGVLHKATQPIGRSTSFLASTSTSTRARTRGRATRRHSQPATRHNRRRTHHAHPSVLARHPTRWPSSLLPTARRKHKARHNSAGLSRRLRCTSMRGCSSFGVCRERLPQGKPVSVAPTLPHREGWVMEIQLPDEPSSCLPGLYDRSFLIEATNPSILLPRGIWIWANSSGCFIINSK